MWLSGSASEEMNRKVVGLTPVRGIFPPITESSWMRKRLVIIGQYFFIFSFTSLYLQLAIREIVKKKMVVKDVGSWKSRKTEITGKR